MTNRKRGWRNPPKEVEGTTAGKCPYCNKSVKSLESHIHDKHKGEKGAKETTWNLVLRKLGLR